MVYTQHLQLRSALDHNGWTVVAQQTDHLDWWAAEIWTIESYWRPQGFRLYLTFLIDPQSASEIWTVNATRHYPQQQDELLIYLPFRNSWEQKLPTFINDLNALRAQDPPA